MDPTPPFDFPSAAANCVELLGCDVFPLLAKDCIPCRWGTEATRDPLTHARWARRFPDLTGVGIALDQALYVFDADGPEAVAWCEKQLPHTFTVNTSRGRHYYLQVEHGHRLRLLGTGLGKLFGVPKLDGKTKGGYVVGPGSVHRSGAVYAVHTDLKVARMPARLARRIGQRHDDRAMRLNGALVGSDISLTPDEAAEFDGNAAWGAALRPEADADAARTLRQLEEYCTISDEGWGDAFRDAGVQLGLHIPSGALSFDECLNLLEWAFARLDTWGCEGGHVLRSIRRGLVYGARTERASWL